MKHPLAVAWIACTLLFGGTTAVAQGAPQWTSKYATGFEEEDWLVSQERVNQDYIVFGDPADPDFAAYPVPPQLSYGTTYGRNGTKGVRIHANQYQSPKSNLIIAHQNVSPTYVAGVWRYSLHVRIPTVVGDLGQAGPVFTMQNTRFKPGQSTITETLEGGLLYSMNPWDPNYKSWLIWRGPVTGWEPAAWAPELEFDKWYKITFIGSFPGALEAGGFRYQSVKFECPDDPSFTEVYQVLDLPVVASEKGWPSEAFQITVEAENLWTGPSWTGGPTELRIDCDDVALDRAADPRATAAAQWIEGSMQRSTGAILTGNIISPYFGNLAAIGLARRGLESHGAVRAWMDWYLSHLNFPTPDKWCGLGTIYDYTVAAGGSEVSLETTDATDSNAATFLSLARAYFEAGDAEARQYVISKMGYLELLGYSVLVLSIDTDGLSTARPDYPVKYLMDNCEVVAGLRDLSWLLENAAANPGAAVYYSNWSEQVRQAIEQELWDAVQGTYSPYKDNAGNLGQADWTCWYPDATSQLFPVLTGVLDRNDPRAVSLYDTLNAHHPGWSTLNKPDPFPWTQVGYVAAIMGDDVRARAYVDAIDQSYVTAGFPWPFHSMEGGFLIRILEALGPEQVQ